MNEHLLLSAAAVLLLVFAPAPVAAGEEPTPRPDSGSSTEEKPVNPFGDVRPGRPDAVPGKLVLSDGKEHRGRLYLTRDRKLELFEDARKEWHKLALKDLKSVSFSIEKEDVVREWRWKEPGSDVKVETGRTKVDRRYLCAAERSDGTRITGHVRGTVIYVDAGKEGAEPERFFLHKDQPGDFGQKPEDLVYVKELVLGEEAAKEPEKKPEEAKPPDGKAPEAAEPKVSLVLVDGGEQKMAVIKVVREITGLGLKEAKELVDGAPRTVKDDLSRTGAEQLLKKLEAAGAKAKVGPP